MLRQNDNIIAAQLYDFQGAPFARFYRDRAEVPMPAAAPGASLDFTWTRLVVVQPLRVLGDTPVGTLYLLADASPLVDCTPRSISSLSCSSCYWACLFPFCSRAACATPCHARS
jgi:hypothetical protein